MRSSRLGLGLILGAIALSIGTYARAQEGEGSFNIATQANGDGTMTTTLTWDTPYASCMASGAPEWEGEKPGKGSATLPPHPTTQPKAYALACASEAETQAFLTWTPPTTNTDGTALTNLAGYRVHWGESAQALSQSAQVANAGATSHTVSNLTPGRAYFFGVRAYTSQGAESALSNIVTKTPTLGTEWSAQTGVKVPSAPTVESVE